LDFPPEGSSEEEDFILELLSLSLLLVENAAKSLALAMRRTEPDHSKPLGVGPLQAERVGLILGG
jgi:hypothetical protein